MQHSFTQSAWYQWKLPLYVNSLPQLIMIGFDMTIPWVTVFLECAVQPPRSAFLERVFQSMWSREVSRQFQHKFILFSQMGKKNGQLHEKASNLRVSRAGASKTHNSGKGRLDYWTLFSRLWYNLQLAIYLMLHLPPVPLSTLCLSSSFFFLFLFFVFLRALLSLCHLLIFSIFIL